MILSAQTLREVRPLKPFVERGVIRGRSYGLSHAGYDIRVAEGTMMNRGDFKLVSSVEEFVMPNNVMAFVHDKSSWAREGLSVLNTVIEPGWRGFLTMELIYYGTDGIQIRPGDPIAQIVFHYLDHATVAPYSGKYQDQEAGAQAARYEYD